MTLMFTSLIAIVTSVSLFFGGQVTPLGDEDAAPTPISQEQALECASTSSTTLRAMAGGDWSEIASAFTLLKVQCGTMNDLSATTPTPGVAVPNRPVSVGACGWLVLYDWNEYIRLSTLEGDPCDVLPSDPALREVALFGNLVSKVEFTNDEGARTMRFMYIPSAWEAFEDYDGFIIDVDVVSGLFMGGFGFVYPEIF